MIAEGHQVASHTWSHYSISNITHNLRIAQMVKNEMAFSNIIGMWPTYMRPPYSDCTEESGCWADMQALGYHRVYFDLDTQDYLNPAPSQIQKSKNIVKQALTALGITDYLSIQHDIVQQSVSNLSDYYYGLIQQKGWKGITVGECLGDTDRSNWYRSFNDSSSSATSSVTPTAITKPVTSSPTSKTTATPVSSKPAISTTSSSKTLSKTSASSPTPTTTCEAQNGSWCETIPAFTDKESCEKASVSCYGQTVKCMGGGWATFGVCTKWTQTCFNLQGYCRKCNNGGKCDNVGFGA